MVNNENDGSVAGATPVGNAKTFLGSVVNSETEDRIRGVKVIAVDKKTNNKVEGESDGKGKYSLELIPGTTYVIKFSVAGYQIKQRTVKAAEGKEKTQLGMTELEPSPFGPHIAAENPLITNPEFNREQTIEPVDREETGVGDVLLPPTGEDTEVTEAAEEDASTKIENADKGPYYEVQVGAYSKPDINELKKLQSVGNIYGEKRGSITVFTLGLFEDRNQAVRAREFAIKNGYVGSFIRKIDDISLIEVIKKEVPISPNN